MLMKQQILVDELRRILRGFALGKIKKIAPALTSGNISYLIETDTKRYFLRLCPKGPRFRQREEIAAELELIDYLRANKFPALPAVKNKKREAIISWRGHFGYLREFIGAREKASPNVSEVKKIGEVLGRLHSLTENFRTKNRRLHVFDLPATKKLFKNKKWKILASDFKNKEKFVARFEKEINSLRFPRELPAGMIHEDLGRRHALWRGGEVAAIIDFDRSYFGPLIFDLGQSCRGWCFVHDWSHWSNENFKALISGYEDRRKLTKIEKECLSDAIKFGILERALSFCLRFIDVTHDGEDEQFALDCVFRQLDLLPKKTLFP